MSLKLNPRIKSCRWSSHADSVRVKFSVMSHIVWMRLLENINFRISHISDLKCRNFFRLILTIGMEFLENFLENYEKILCRKSRKSRTPGDRELFFRNIPYYEAVATKSWNYLTTSKFFAYEILIPGIQNFLCVRIHTVQQLWRNLIILYKWNVKNYSWKLVVENDILRGLSE